MADGWHKPGKVSLLPHGCQLPHALDPPPGPVLLTACRHRFLSSPSKTFFLFASEASQLYSANPNPSTLSHLGAACVRRCFHKRKYHHLKTNKLREQDAPFVFEGRLPSVGSYRDLSAAIGDKTRCLLQNFPPTQHFRFRPCLLSR